MVSRKSKQNRPGGQLEQVAIESLCPAPRNPRKHSRAQIEKLEKSIRTFGFINPVLIDSANVVIAGHGRLEAAKELGLRAVPVVRVEHLTPAQRRAYLVADNRLAELATWDHEFLSTEMQKLIVEAPELDLTATGFETAEIDRLVLGDVETCSDDPADDLPPLVREDVVCRDGDLWHLGEHRVLIGDAREPDSYRRLLGRRRADLAFTDPPYNVRIKGHARKNGRHQHRDFEMACGELSEIEFAEFLQCVFSNMAAISKAGAVHFTCIDWRHLYEALVAGRSVYDTLLNLCIWDKETGGMGSLYRSLESDKKEGARIYRISARHSTAKSKSATAKAQAG